MLKTSLAIFLWAVTWFHPFHVTVMEILHKPQEKVVQVSVRIFMDDLEQALRAETGNTNLNITAEDDYDYLNGEVGNYLGNRIRLTSKKPIALQYLGFEYEDDVLWCYFEATKVKKFDFLEVENSILTEAFSDQENLVHFRRSGEVRSARLSAQKTTERFNLEGI